MKVRAKCPVLEAVQFTSKDEPLPKGVRCQEAKWGGGDYYQSFFNAKYGPIYKFYVETPEGMVEVKVGDWIVYGPAEIKMCFTDTVFKKMFDEV